MFSPQAMPEKVPSHGSIATPYCADAQVPLSSQEKLIQPVFSDQAAPVHRSVGDGHPRAKSGLQIEPADVFSPCIFMGFGVKP
jgi:hypothetical protein